MRPPTRSTRSVRTHSNKTTTNARRSRNTSPGPPTPLASSEAADNTNVTSLPKSRPQRTSSSSDVKVDPGTSPGLGSVPAGVLAPPGPVIGCFPVFPPPPTAVTAATFILENESRPPHHETLPLVDPYIAGGSPLPFVSGNLKPARPRHRMSSEKLETLDAIFRRNTHPSRKEKEAISKDLEVDIKTVTIWFQNKRQTVARSRKLLRSEGASPNDNTSTTAIDMLASASAKMSPLAPAVDATPVAAVADDDVKPSASSISAPTTNVHLGSDIGRPRSECSTSLDRSVPRLQRTKSLPFASSRPPLRHSAATHDSNVFESVRAQPPSTCGSSPSPDLNKPRLAHGWSIHPEDLWKHIPSSPALPVLSSPDVSPDIDTPSRSSRFSTAPRTLEWACARSAKRRRMSPDNEDGETDSERNSVNRSYPYHSSFSVSEARVPLECYDKYPLDVVRGAVLLLGLRDERHGLGI